MMTWDPMDCLSYRSLRAFILHGPHLAMGYCPLHIICPSCHVHFAWYAYSYASVTHALHYTWWLIILVCVFPSLVEISLIIAMLALCPMPMMILWSCFVFVLAICHVHCLCLLFTHMTWLPWFSLVCCIFALLACTTWLLCLLALLHLRWLKLAPFMRLMTTIYMLCTWLLLLLVIYLHILPPHARWFAMYWVQLCL